MTKWTISCPIIPHKLLIISLESSKRFNKMSPAHWQARIAICRLIIVSHLSEYNPINHIMTVCINNMVKLTSYPCLHLHTALLPVEVQSALTPQGSWEHGSALHLTNGSPVYPGGHLQIARLPNNNHHQFYLISVLWKLLQMQTSRIWKIQNRFILLDRWVNWNAKLGIQIHWLWLVKRTFKVYSLALNPNHILSQNKIDKYCILHFCEIDKILDLFNDCANQFWWDFGIDWIICLD